MPQGVVIYSVGIFGDVLADAVEGFFVTDDVLVIVALPDRCAGSASQGVDAFGRCGFETNNEQRQRTGWSLKERMAARPKLSNILDASCLNEAVFD